MVGRVIVGSLLAAVAVFGWSYVYWTVLPWSNQVFKTMPGQERFLNDMREAVPESGVYLIPGGMDLVEKEGEEAFAARLREGPIAMVMYFKAGTEPMPPSMLAYGFLHTFIACLIASIIIAASEAKTYFSRVMLIFWVGVFTAVWVEVANVIWYYFPRDYCVLKIVYHVTSCLLMGLVLAAFVRPAQVNGAEA